MSEISTTCKEKNKRGEPCQAAARPSGYCWAHDPALAAKRAAAHQKGGRARHGRQIGPTGELREPIKLVSAADVMQIVEIAVNDALTLEKSVNRSRLLGYLAGVAISALEASEFEQRLSEIERQLGGDR